MSGSGRNACLSRPEAGVLDELYSANPAQRSSHTGPPGYIGWTRFQPTYVDWRACTATPLSGVSCLLYKVRLKLPPLELILKIIVLETEGEKTSHER
jgi:hypothetical protein